MIIGNVTMSELESALYQTNTEFEGNVIWNRVESEGRRFRVTLRVRDSKGSGARRSASGRRLVSACWHVHGTFFDALPTEAVIRTAGRVKRPGDVWEDWNIGSMMYPTMHSQACDC
ncbi:hypothetical protein CMI37_03560 [Candidatus Pacearchaeota archaeon]|nr:hypothetical protein [Candidatus Pacearchaeota archaeon]